MERARTLDQVPVRSLRGVGPQLAEKLARLDIHSVQDLLFHLPLRYQDRTRITPIGALQPGQDAVIEGEVKVADVAFGRRRSLVVRLQDPTGTVTLRFFHFSAAQQKQLARGSWLRAYGEARRGANGVELYHPEYRLLEDEAPAPVAQTLTPVYPTTEGLQQASWRKLCGQALQLLGPDSLVDHLREPPPREVGRASLSEAVRFLHQPPPDVAQQQLLDGVHPF